MPRDAVDLLDNATCDPDVTWTTGNVAEAFPGLFTTLMYSFVHEPMDRAFREMLHQLGVFTAADLPVPARPEEQFWSAFAGRAAANVNSIRRVAGLIPGTSASAVETQLFGYVRPGTVDDNSLRRYPQVALRAPRRIAALPKRHDTMFAQLREWRLDRLRGVPDLDEAGCVALIDEARSRFGRIMVEHLLVAFVSSGLADKLAALTVATGRPDLEAQLLSGVGSDEGEVAHDLWALAHERLTLGVFLDRHGYHGPNEGQLSGVSWREDPSPVLARLAAYGAIAADDPRAPRTRAAAQREVRTRAAAELAAALPRLKGRQVGMLTTLSARYLALREQGKAGYLLTLDVARAASRRLGALLAHRGVLAGQDDVFHLTLPELRAGPGVEVAELVAARLALFRERGDLRLPKAWDGVPTVSTVAAGEPAAAGTVLRGVAAGGGVAVGRARVVLDPSEVELDDGDVLVCEATDPGWVSLFLVAAAVVTDHGGMLSHGAIVARELGLPCVCGTEDGSRRIPEGARIRVDGAAGTVEILT